MASPFSMFRRNQKVLLATVGLAAIIAFVFLTPLMSYMGGGSNQPNPVVVETNYGDLTRNELENLQYSRDIVDRFLRQLSDRVVANQITQRFLDPRLAQMAQQRIYLMARARMMAPAQQDPARGAIESMILAKRAEELGMVISDQAINDALKQITGDSITAAELQEIIRGLQPTRPISVRRLFASIRAEMLAAKYSELFARSLDDIPPAQRFEYFSRLNRRALAEVMPLAVGDFIDQVADPTDAELKEYYDRYKNDFPNPDSPEPGFKQPQRATFQYFKANIDQLTEKIKPEITEQEISKYYDDNKEQFRAFDFDDEEAKTDEPSADEKPDAAEPDGEQPPDEPKADADQGDEKGNQPESEKPAPSEETPEAKPEEKPAEPEANQDEANKDEPPPQASRTTARLNVRFVSTTQTDTAPPKEGAGDAKTPVKPSDEASQEPDAPATDEKPSDEKPTDEKPTDKKSADEKPAAASEKPDASPPTEKTAEPAAESDMPAEEPVETRFEPLEKVADTIRTSLARGRAEVRVTEQFDELSAPMRRFTDEFDIYTAEKGIDAKAKPPTPLDFAKLAENKDVQALELKSVTAAEAAETDLGKAFRVVSNPRSQFPFTVPFVDFAFAETLPTHKPEVIQDNENHAYLFWKTAEEPAFVPPLDQIRGKVTLAWKMIKARELARKRGEEFAVQARSLKKPLAELFGSQSKLQITDTGQFSWLTLGNVPSQPAAQPRLSEVEGVDRAGKDFMRTAFALEPAEVGVAINEPQTFVYVIRLIEFEPPMEELRDDFARTNPSRYMAAAVDDQRAIYRSWLSDLNKDAGVNWIRQADGRGPNEDEAGF